MKHARLSLVLLVGCATPRPALPPRDTCITIVGRWWISSRPIEAVSSRLADCYEAHELSGTSASVRFSVRVGPDGSVLAAGLASAVGIGVETSRCVERVLRSTSFDPPEGGGQVARGHILFLGPDGAAPESSSTTQRPPIDLDETIASEMPSVVVVPARVPAELVWMHEARLLVEACVDPPAMAPERQLVSLRARVEPTGEAGGIAVTVSQEASLVLRDCIAVGLEKGAFRPRKDALAQDLSATFAVTKGVVTLVR